jgi:hypothetical protein
MKKLISTLTIVALSPLASFAGNADFIFGSAIGLGGALFSNSNTITLGYFAKADDDSDNTLSAEVFTPLEQPLNNVAVGNDPFGNPGFAHDAFSVVGLPTNAEGEVMYIKLSADVGDAYITDSAWSVIAATNPPFVPPLNNATIGHANPEQISFAAEGLAVEVTSGGIDGTGLAITVIPSPAPSIMTDLVQVRYWSGDAAEEYHYYETEASLFFIDSSEWSNNAYNWDPASRKLTDYTFNEYLVYVYDTADSGTFMSSSGGVGTFINYPASWDLDYDGTADGIQIKNGGVPSYALGQIDLGGDDDGDGLTLAAEGALGTNPAAADTDGDDLSDWAEVYVHSTDPSDSDTSGDGLTDGFVVAAGFDPLSNYSSLYSGIEELRPGAIMLAVNGGIAAFRLQIERSSDLTSWSASKDDVMTFTIPVEGNKQFFRFAMPQD